MGDRGLIYAKIDNEIVTIISYAPQDGFIKVPDYVVAGYCCLPGGSFCPQTISLDDCKSLKMQYLRSKFDEEYSGGFHSDGIFYTSDDANRYRITKAKANSGGLVMNSGDMVMLDEAKSVQVDSDMNTNLDNLDVRLYDAQKKVIAATTNDEVNAVVL